MEVEADVSESNVAKLHSGQPAQVSVEAFPDRGYRAVLRQVIPTADRTKATVMVKVTILDKDKDLKPEMSAKATFLEPAKRDSAAVDSGKPIVSVPKDAIATRNGKAVAALLAVRDDEELEGLILGHSARLRGLLENARQQIREGEGISHEDFWQEMSEEKPRKVRGASRGKTA